jgi:hypothetical protein
MGFETIPETNVQYGQISFDAGGNERSEQSGLISQALPRKVTAESITNPAEIRPRDIFRRESDEICAGEHPAK